MGDIAGFGHGQQGYVTDDAVPLGIIDQGQWGRIKDKKINRQRRAIRVASQQPHRQTQPAKRLDTTIDYPSDLAHYPISQTRLAAPGNARRNHGDR
ncbi:hypothetical protein QNM99_03130 [Pseudomonas sp. PCH446]